MNIFNMNWIYETGRSESKILGSGSQYFDMDA